MSEDSQPPVILPSEKFGVLLWPLQKTALVCTYTQICTYTHKLFRFWLLNYTNVNGKDTKDLQETLIHGTCSRVWKLNEATYHNTVGQILNTASKNMMTLIISFWHALVRYQIK